MIQMIEIYLKYDNMDIFGMINALNSINNPVISCINNMLSHPPTWIIASLLAIHYVIFLESLIILWSCN